MTKWIKPVSIGLILLGCVGMFISGSDEKTTLELVGAGFALIGIVAIALKK